MKELAYGKDPLYEEARLDEYKLIGKVCAECFYELSILTVIKRRFKKPRLSSFYWTVHTLLVKLYIKKRLDANEMEKL